MLSPRVIADPILEAQEYRLEILLQSTNCTPVRNVSRAVFVRTKWLNRPYTYHHRLILGCGVAYQLMLVATMLP